MNRFLASLGMVVFALGGTGCELIVDFDRERIDGGGGGDMDSGPDEDAFVPDEDGGPDTGGGDAGCEGMPASFCDDTNDCTTDACDTTTGSCTNMAIAGCCNNDTDCADTDECTTDACDMGTHMCSNDRRTDCCTSGGPATQCDDGADCTMDTCTVATMTCAHSPIAGCCTVMADCMDTNPCTTDMCIVATGTCTNVMTPGCCATAADCGDGDTCTVDDCDGSMMCTNTMTAGCCTMDDMCSDSDVCTTNQCNTTINECEFPAIVGCCENDGDCPDDGNVCTVESCNLGTNRCQSMDAATTVVCDDGMFCTTGETCDAGACGGGMTRNCADADACTVDSCDEMADMCRNASARNSILAVQVDEATTNDSVRLRNPSATLALDVSGFFVCRSDMAAAPVACFDIPSGTSIPGGGTLIVRSGTGTDTATEIFSGGDLGIDFADGEVAVSTGMMGTAVCDYVQWGMGMHTLADDAVTAMEWSAAADFVDATMLDMAGESLRWDPAGDPDNDAPARWSVSSTF